MFLLTPQENFEIHFPSLSLMFLKFVGFFIVFLFFTLFILFYSLFLLPDAILDCGHWPNKIHHPSLLSHPSYFNLNPSTLLLKQIYPLIHQLKGGTCVSHGAILYLPCLMQFLLSLCFLHHIFPNMFISFTWLPFLGMILSGAPLFPDLSGTSDSACGATEPSIGHRPRGLIQNTDTGHSVKRIPRFY